MYRYRHPETDKMFENGYFSVNRYAVPLHPVPDSVHSNQCPAASLQDIRDACQRLKPSLQLTEQEVDDLEKKTRGQSTSALWHESHIVAIDCIKCSPNCEYETVNMPFIISEQLLYFIGKCQTKAMQLGLEREDAATQRYKSQKHLDGEELTIKEAGFRVTEKGFLGLSVDRIVTDVRGRQNLVELKNPEN